MADSDTKEDTIASKKTQNVANISLSIATIITALHENALEKCQAKSKGVVIANSAIDGEGEKAKLKSSGEHIISAMPLDGKKPLDKKTAVDVLQSYVQWFAGPDLAQKVNDSTVKALDEPPGESKPANDKDNKEEMSDGEKTSLSESKKFISFQKFLLLEDANEEIPDEDANKNPENDGSKEEMSNGEKTIDDNNGKDTDGKDTNETVPNGYYIPYRLKVEGLPQTALKDAVKKFAATFFDDVTFTASGLLGGGGKSFTVKDVKDSLKSVFGSIDPDQLVSNIRSTIEKKMPSKDASLDVEVRSKQTLIADLGNDIDAQQKKKIDNANYSLWISIEKDDSRKNVFNPRVMADIVTSSIKGLYKKFKNAVNKNDVIFIPDYIDTNADTRKIRQLYASVPTYQQMQDLAKGKKPFTAIENALDKLKKNDSFDNCNRAQQAYSLWNEFKKKSPSKDVIDKLDSEDMQMKQFEGFLKTYKDMLNDTKDDELEESYNANKGLQMLLDLPNIHRIHNDTIRSLMAYLLEDDGTASKAQDDANGKDSSDENGSGTNRTLSKDRRNAIATTFAKALQSKFGISQKFSINPPDAIDMMDMKNVVNVGSINDTNKLLKNFINAAETIDSEKKRKNFDGSNTYLLTVVTTKPSAEDSNKDASLAESIENELLRLLLSQESGMLNEENAIDQYIVSNKLTKKQALSDKHIDAMRKETHKNADFVKSKIESHFQSHKQTKSKNSNAVGQSSLPLSYDDIKNFVQQFDFSGKLNIDDSTDDKPFDHTPFKIDYVGDDATVFCIPFGIEKEDAKNFETVSLDGNSALKTSKSKGKIDLYVIPMPGLKYGNEE